MDNTNILRKFMDFSDPDKFYLIHIMRRRKDNPDMDKSERIIRTYSIPSMESFDRMIPEIKTMCSTFNARAYMYINRRSFKGTAKAMLKRLAEIVIDGDPHGLSNLYQSCASAHGVGDGYWILDIDFNWNNDELAIYNKDKQIDYVSCSIEYYIDNEEIQPVGKKSVYRIPSKNGIHLITKRFETRAMERLNNDLIRVLNDRHQYKVEVELKKDAMVNLYIPE